MNERMREEKIMRAGMGNNESYWNGKGERRNMKGVSKRERESLLINIHDIHTSMYTPIYIANLCRLISQGIGAESPI